jgi:hypothetical protein
MRVGRELVPERRGFDRHMRGVLALALLVVAGCDQLFGLLRVDLTPDARSDAMDGGIDSSTADALSDARPDGNPIVGCPSSYSSFNGTHGRYRLVTTPTAWAAAQSVCLDDQGLTGPGFYTHLVVLGNDVERGFVGSAVIGNGNSGWVGLSDRKTSNNFLWVTNENTNGYPPAQGGPWAVNEPSGGAGEDCVRMNGQSDFADHNCNDLLRFACECDSHPNVATNY